MESLQRSLKTTLEFLKKNQKMDQASYDQIEGSQVRNLLKQCSKVRLELEEGTALITEVNSSVLNEQHKISLVQSLSQAMCKEAAGVKTQYLLSGFLNYLTKSDRVLLSDDKSHPFTRLQGVMERCLSLGLVFPGEKTYGHIIATMNGCFNMGTSAKDSNDLLKELKRLVKTSRIGTEPSLESFPEDPRDLPRWLFDKCYVKGDELEPVKSANYRPGKWLRGSSKDLTAILPLAVPSGRGKASMNAMGMDPIMMQNMMFQNMQMMNQMQNAGALQDGQLSNLVLFPKRKRSSMALGDGRTSMSLTDSQDEDRQGNAPALQDQEVRNDEFCTTKAADLQAADLEAADDVEDHLSMMNAARKAAKDAKPGPGILKRPAAKGNGKTGGKGKTMATSKGNGKSNSKVLTSPKAKAKSRPKPIPKGGPTCHWMGGKIHRSDTSQTWRVFKKKGDRCDHKIHWKGNLKVSWEKALDYIEAAQ